jgi:hypothetical protein
MSKIPAQSSTQLAPQDRPKALDTLTAITEQVIAFRYADRTPNLVDIGRVVIGCSRAMHVKDTDERISVENATVLAIAKRHGIVN